MANTTSGKARRGTMSKAGREAVSRAQLKRWRKWRADQKAKAAKRKGTKRTATKRKGTGKGRKKGC